jgi:hypothetical protein
VAPIALLLGGCLEEPSSPADFVDYSAPPTPTMITVVPARSDAMAQWQLPADSPWSAYQKLTLLSALDETPQTWELPDVEALPEVSSARAAARAVAAAGLPADTAWFVDLRGAASIAFARALGETGTAQLAVVPTFNHWPAEDEMIPAEETLAAMVRMPPSRAIAPGAHPMFLLDSWRLSSKSEEVDEETYDNRYALTAGDLPTAEALWAQGIRRVVYMVPWRSDAVHEEDDLNAIFRDYEARGIEIAVLGLDDLLAVRAADDWTVGWPRWRYVTVSRPVIVNSQAFLYRARSGWGGVHYVGGGGWHMGGGYHSAFVYPAGTIHE